MMDPYVIKIPGIDHIHVAEWNIQNRCPGPLRKLVLGLMFLDAPMHPYKSVGWLVSPSVCQSVSHSVHPSVRPSVRQRRHNPVPF